MIKIFMDVKGMVCAGCETRIKNVLKDWEHVNIVDASFETGKVIIEADIRIEEQILKEKLMDFDFEVINISYE